MVDKLRFLSSRGLVCNCSCIALLLYLLDRKSVEYSVEYGWESEVCTAKFADGPNLRFTCVILGFAAQTEDSMLRSKIYGLSKSILCT